MGGRNCRSIPLMVMLPGDSRWLIDADSEVGVKGRTLWVGVNCSDLINKMPVGES